MRKDNYSINPFGFDNIDSMFYSMFGDMLPPVANRRSFSTLSTDFFYENGAVILNIDIAGSSSDDVTLDYDKDSETLTVRIAKQYEKKEQKPHFYIRERVLSDQSRSFRMPAGIDAETLTADVKNGLLTIRANIKVVDKDKSLISIKVNSSD